MKTHVLVLISMLLFSFQSFAEETKQAYELPDNSFLRINADYLVVAQKTHLTFIYDDKILTKIELLFTIDRKELLKFLPPQTELKINEVTILSLDPDKPVYIQAEAKQPLVDDTREYLAKGNTFEQIFMRKSKNQFPLYYDLEYYKIRGWLQEYASFDLTNTEE